MQDAVTVRDVMSREFLGVSEGDTLDEVVDVMVAERVSSVVVVRGDELVGLVTEQDLLELIATDQGIDDRTVDDVMRPPPEPIGAERNVTAALDDLANTESRELPVSNGNDELVGVLSESDLLTASASLFVGTDHTSPAEEVVTAGPGAEHGTGVRAEDPFETEAAGIDAESVPNGPEDSYSTQSVCESCGSLASDLADFNGQLLCRECRDV